MRAWPIVALWAAAAAMIAPPAAGQAPAGACAGPEYSQFDFWLGTWAVSDRASGRQVGTSRVEKLHGGCVIRERYEAGNFSGESLNIFWNGDGRWHQSWTDSAGAFRHFVGELSSRGEMVLTARQPGKAEGEGHQLVRMRFTANPDGTVRQYSDLSTDGGTSWQPRYDFLYRKAD